MAGGGLRARGEAAIMNASRRSWGLRRERTRICQCAGCMHWCVRGATSRYCHRSRGPTSSAAT